MASNAKTLVNFSADSFGEMSLTESVSVLEDAGKAVNKGDLYALERMLTAQAVALDSIFCSMAHRAKMNVGHYPETVGKYMNLALRAQSQCRATVEALAEIKNPQPYIQNNKAQYQQVNNGKAEAKGYFTTNTHAHAGHNPNSTNKLLEDLTHEQEWLDAGTPETASGNDKELENRGKKAPGRRLKRARV